MGIRSLLLIIFISLSGFLGAQTTPTHVLIKFVHGASEGTIAESISRVPELATYDKSYRLPNPDVVILPIKYGEFEEIAFYLKLEEAITYIAPAYTNEKGQFVTFTDELFVKVQNEDDLKLLERYVNVSRSELLGETAFLDNVYRVRVNKNSPRNAHEFAELLKRSNQFEYAEANYLFTPIVPAVDPPDDPIFNRQWNMLNTGEPQQYNGEPEADMNVLDAWETTMGSPDIKIAILDSGVDTLHEDLADNMASGLGYDAVGDGRRGFPNNNYDEDGHGTCCAGIAAAVANNGIGIAGVAPQCKIIPIRVFYYTVIGTGGDVQPWSTAEWFADGITWAWKNAGADVASNSWGVPDFLLDFIDPNGEGVALVNDAIEQATTKGRGGLGTPYLFSSGNDGVTDTIPIWPARYEATIAVNAMSMCDEAKTKTSCDHESWWAGNWGNGLDISAPGVKIPATDMTGGDGFKPGEYYNTFNGTSSACPNAAGVMALILSANSRLLAEDARSIISTTCDKVGGYDYDVNKKYGTWSKDLGYGKVNAQAAVAMASTTDSWVDNTFTYYDESTSSNYLHFFMQTEGEAELEVYDIMGNLIKSFSAGNYSQGNKNVLINSNELKTGIYIVRLKMPNEEKKVKFFAFRKGE